MKEVLIRLSADGAAMIWILSNSKAGGVREDRWLLGEGCGGQREVQENTHFEILIWGVPGRLDTELKHLALPVPPPPH